MSIVNELPQAFKPLVVLGEIDGYLHIYSFLDDEVLVAIIEMALNSVENRDYDENTTTLQ